MPTILFDIFMGSSYFQQKTCKGTFMRPRKEVNWSRNGKTLWIANKNLDDILECIISMGPSFFYSWLIWWHTIQNGDFHSKICYVAALS